MISCDAVSQMTPDELRALWLNLLGCAPSSRSSDRLMIRVLASEMQWQTSGQSRAALSQQLQSALKATGKDLRKAKAGARLIREWNGKEHVVDVTDEGFVWRDRTWRSLSAIAKEITGTKWSGPRFFGVTV